MRPLFIVFEGIDGSGKSTQIDILREKLSEYGREATITHEPTDGVLGRMLRNVLAGDYHIEPIAFSALYLADRLHHILDEENGMLAILNAGKDVIASRYYFSTYAFQGDYVDMNWLASCNSQCKKLLKADITFYIQVPPEVCLKRLQQSRPKLDIYENLEKLTRTHDHYMDAFERFGIDENIHMIDGEQSIEKISKDIWKKVSALLSSAR